MTRILTALLIVLVKTKTKATGINGIRRNVMNN